MRTDTALVPRDSELKLDDKEDEKTEQEYHGASVSLSGAAVRLHPEWEKHYKPHEDDRDDEDPCDCAACIEARSELSLVLDVMGLLPEKVEPEPVVVPRDEGTRCDVRHRVCTMCGVCRCTSAMGTELETHYPNGIITVKYRFQQEAMLCKRCVANL